MIPSQDVEAIHGEVGLPAGSLGFTNIHGKRRDEVRKGYKEALKVCLQPSSK